MDHIRRELDQLMGKDRNVPLSYRNKKKEHFSDPDVIGTLDYSLGLQALLSFLLST